MGLWETIRLSLRNMKNFPDNDYTNARKESLST